MGECLYRPDVSDEQCGDCQFFKTCKEPLKNEMTPACEKFKLYNGGQEGVVFVLTSEYTNGKKEMNGVFSSREKAENFANEMSNYELDGVKLKKYQIKSWFVL